MSEKPLVIVEWLDSQDHPDKWVDKADAESFTDVDCKIRSVGFLVRKTEKYLTLAGDWDDVDQDYGRVTKVSINMILSIVELK